MLPIALLASCVALEDLPDLSLVAPAAGCTVVAVSPAEPLRPRSGGNGGGDRRALIRHEADCVPDVGPMASTLLSYRLQFEQEFTHGRVYPGGQRVWVGGEARYVDDSDQPRRQLDAATQAQGKNCAVLLEKLTSRTVPCLEGRDPAMARHMQRALQAFRAQSRFTVNVNGDNGLNALRLGRDTACLQHWQQVQAQWDSRSGSCRIK